MDWSRLTEMLTPTREAVAGLVDRLKWIVLCVGAAYLLAVGLSAWMVRGMTSTALGSLTRLAGKSQAAVTASHMSGLSAGGGANYRDIEKAIRDRNLFNSSGEFPDESKPNTDEEAKKPENFDINAPCSKATVNVELLGTIVMDPTGSLATLREQGYGEADIYREGDLLIGSDTAVLAKIERNRVIINNRGVKECIELAAGLPKRDTGGFPEVPPTAPPAPAEGAPAGGDQPAAAGGDCALDEKYVQDELGPGFGTIIQKARLVPNTVDNQMSGFKIFAIDQGSLLGKVGLQNGDIITQVNDTSLKQPEQGFTLYQAFQDEREVRINILRRGTTPMMITCRIK